MLFSLLWLMQASRALPHASPRIEGASPMPSPRVSGSCALEVATGVCLMSVLQSATLYVLVLSPIFKMMLPAREVPWRELSSVCATPSLLPRVSGSRALDDASGVCPTSARLIAALFVLVHPPVLKLMHPARAMPWRELSSVCASPSITPLRVLPSRATPAAAIAVAAARRPAATCRRGRPLPYYPLPPPGRPATWLRDSAPNPRPGPEPGPHTPRPPSAARKRTAASGRGLPHDAPPHRLYRREQRREGGVGYQYSIRESQC